jgi:hypothetical protein
MFMDFSILSKFDFSTLKNIDFLNVENLLFFAIFLIIFIIILLVFLIIVVKIIKIIKKLFIGLLNLSIKKNKLGQDNSTSKLVQPQNSQATNRMPQQNVVGGDYIKASNIAGNGSGGSQKSSAISYKENEEKMIAEGLSKLKASYNGEIPTSNLRGKEHLISKLNSPSSSTNEPLAKDGADKRFGMNKKFTDNNFLRWASDKIKINKKSKGGSKKEEEKKEGDAVVISSGLHTSKLTYDKKQIEAARKNLQGQNNVPKKSEGAEGVKEPKDLKDLHGHALAYEKKKIEEAKKVALKTKAKTDNVMFSDETNVPKKSLEQKPKENKTISKDGSIFSGEPEVSRIKLVNKMKLDPKIWQAQRQSGLTLSPLERAKLVKEVFSPVLGTNISKTDLKWSIKKLNQKMLSAKDPNEHAKIRKEIKFFKKIGGIKD